MASKNSFEKEVLEESDEDSESMLTASKKKTKRRCLEDSDCEMTSDKEDIVNKRSPKSPTTTPRSSERLREKLQRRQTVPSRKEVLDKICDGDYKLYERTSLKPRNLTNDLVRGSSRYVTDKTDIFESTGSDISDFIDDTEDIRPEKKKRKKKRMKGNDEKRVLSSSDSDDDTGTKKSSAQKRRKKCNKVEKCASNGVTVSSGDSDVQLNNSLNKQHRCLTISDDDDDDEKLTDNEIQEDVESKIETCQIKQSSALQKQSKRVPLESDSDNSDTLESNRNIRRRPKSLKKEKEEKLLAKISAKRKFEKSKSTQPNNDTGIELVAQKGMEDVFGDYLMQRKHIILSSSEMEGEELNIEGFSGVDELEEDELDREFVVDDFCDDSDGVTEFFKHLHNSEDSDVTSSNLLESRKKKLNHFKRISVVHESEESDDDISSSFSSDMVAIYNAVQENDLNTAKAVVENNPNVVYEVGSKRQTLLHHAAICGSSQFTKLLIDFGSDKFALDALSLPPVAYAVLYGYTNCLKIFFQDTDLNYLNNILEEHFKFSLLHFIVYGSIALPEITCQAVDNSCLSRCLQILFEQDGLLCLNLMKSYDSYGHTPLAAAVLAGQDECVQYLLDKGAAVDDFETKNGGSLLHFAIECSVNSSMEAEQNKSDCLKILLSTSLKTHINGVDFSGFTPLMYASESGNYDCVLALLECGASVHCKDRHGTTSLHLAAASGDSSCIRLLLDHGHQVDCLDSCGWPPLLYANFAAQESCVLSLMQPNPRQIFVLGDLLRKGKSEAARQRNFKVVKDVLVALANQDAYYRVFNDFIRCNPEFLEEHDKGLLHQTWIAILDFDNKQKWFKKKLEPARKGRIQHLTLIVNRDAVFEDAMRQLECCSGSTFRNCNLAVTFANEPGICTGPKREFFVNICKDIVEPRHKLFHATDDNQYSFLPNAFLAEQAKIHGVIDDDQDSCKLKQENLNSKSLKTSGDDVHEVVEQIGADVQDTVTEDYMDEDGDALVADLDLQDLCNTQSSDPPKLMPTESNAEKYLRCSEIVDKKLEKNLSQLRFLGKIIGTSICQGFFLNLHLSKPLVKQMLGIKLNHPKDLSHLDYQLHKNLVSSVLETDDVEDLMLPCDLDVINPWNNHLATVKLFPEDRKEEWLTDKNKAEYVELVSQYKLTTLIKREIDSICEGLYEVIPKEFFSLFTADEFSLLINGVGKIDVEDWKKNTLYSNVGIRSDIIKWFWEIVSELKENEKALLLKFSTGSPCLPAGGFAELRGLGGVNKFQIVINKEYNKIPTASTCFNRLKLTNYDNAKQLKDKLLIAIRHGTEGFSFS